MTDAEKIAYLRTQWTAGDREVNLLKDDVCDIAERALTLAERAIAKLEAVRDLINSVGPEESPGTLVLANMVEEILTNDTK